jgi:hypothetical protein
MSTSSGMLDSNQVRVFAVVGSQACPIIMTWFSNLNLTVKAALIAALVTLTGILIKDVIVAFLLERKKTEKELREVFQKYADPLSSAATSLLCGFMRFFQRRVAEPT